MKSEIQLALESIRATIDSLERCVTDSPADLDTLQDIDQQIARSARWVTHRKNLDETFSGVDIAALEAELRPIAGQKMATLGRFHGHVACID